MPNNILAEVLNAVYVGAVAECEAREAAGMLHGNGHHMAQKIVEHVKAELVKRKLFWTDEEIAEIKQQSKELDGFFDDPNAPSR